MTKAGIIYIAWAVIAPAENPAPDPARLIDQQLFTGSGTFLYEPSCAEHVGQSNVREGRWCWDPEAEVLHVQTVDGAQAIAAGVNDHVAVKWRSPEVEEGDRPFAMEWQTFSHDQKLSCRLQAKRYATVGLVAPTGHVASPSSLASAENASTPEKPGGAQLAGDTWMVHTQSSVFVDLAAYQRSDNRYAGVCFSDGKISHWYSHRLNGNLPKDL